MSVELPRYISHQEWEYLEGVIDQLLVFGIWQQQSRGFVHRINAFSTSRSIINCLYDQFGGKIGERDRREESDQRNNHPHATKIHYEWRIANAEAGLDFLDLTTNHLSFKRPIAEKYAAFLEAKLEGVDSIDERLEEFLEAKRFSSPRLNQPYLLSVRNLAGRIDADGFIGIQTESKNRSKKHYAYVILATEFSELGLSLQQRFGGSYDFHRTSKIWVATHERAAKFLREILPDLRNLRENAQLVLDFHEVNKLLSRKGGCSRQRELLLRSLQLVSPDINRDKLLGLFIEKSHYMNAHPI